MRKTSILAMLVALLILSVPAWSAETQNVTITVTIEYLAVTIDEPTVPFDVMALSDSKVADTAVNVTNDGTVEENFGLRITDPSDPDGWTSGTTLADVGADKYVLGARKAAEKPAVGDYVDTDVIQTDVTMGDDTNFGGFGYNVASKASEKIFFLMKTMTSVTDPSQHSIIVEVSCQKYVAP